jgi:hypothetical protein
VIIRKNSSKNLIRANCQENGPDDNSGLVPKKKNSVNSNIGANSSHSHYRNKTQVVKKNISQTANLNNDDGPHIKSGAINGNVGTMPGTALTSPQNNVGDANVMVYNQALSGTKN